MQSPFKFLDAYKQEDFEIFFGREKETEALYDALSGVKHLLVYGQSGVGKTSLIECGLRNQFSEADWFALSIRKGENINQSVFARINEALKKKIDLNEQGFPKETGYDFGDAIQSLFDEKYQPIYLLFDQFEELLILGEREEQQAFFERLDKLIRYKVPCRVILVMREEFIGYLSEFEETCPTIFEHRFRVEKMGRVNALEVIQETLENDLLEEYFEVQKSEKLAQIILDKILDNRKEIELTYVQVFLDELWQRAKQEKPTGKPIIQPILIQTEENLDNLLDSFLKKQLEELKENYPSELPIEVLVQMISKQNTKLQVTLNSLRASLQANNLPTENMTSLMQDLENRRIIRSIKVGEQSQYEISHDTLALVVGENRTEEMKRREKANEIFGVFQEKTGYFSQEDLDLLRVYMEFWKQKPDLEQRIHASETHLKTEKEKVLAKAQAQAEKEAKLREKAEKSAQKSKKSARISIGVAVLALLVAILAILYYFQAEEQERLANQRKNQADSLRIEAEDEKNKAIEAKKEVQQKSDSLQKTLQELSEAITAKENAEKQKQIQEEFNRLQEELNVIERIPKEEIQDKINRLKRLLNTVEFEENKQIIQSKINQI